MKPASFLSLLSAAWLAIFAAPACLAADAAAHYQLTEAKLQKLEAVDAEAKRLGLDDEADEDDEDADDADDIDAIVRKIEANPQYRALLARHGLTARELGLSVEAMLHAGVYLAFEKSMDKQAAAKLYGGYTAAQKANIELLRKRTPAAP